MPPPRFVWGWSPLLLALLAQTASAGVLDLPPRFMWGWSAPGGLAPPTASGYCGSASVQTTALYYGNWLTQDAIRETSGGHNGKHALLLGVRGSGSVMSACEALKLNCSSWDYNEAPNPQSSEFITWASAAIDAGSPVIFGVFWAEESDGDYDHIVPMVGYSDDAIYFNDLHSNSTTRAALPGFVTSRKHCTRPLLAEPAESWKFCLPHSVDYGVIVHGNLDAQRAGLLPLQLIMKTNSEPDYSKEDREHQPPVLLSAVLTATGLAARRKYVLLRYTSPADIPQHDLLRHGGYSDRTEFTATGARHSFPVTFMSNTTTLFRCVPAGGAEPAASASVSTAAAAVGVGCCCHPKDSPADCAALCALWTSMGERSDLGPWGAGASVCSWGVQHGNEYTGASCTNGRVTSLVLENLVPPLTGTLPEAISNLTALTKLSLWQNRMSGVLPLSLGELASLRCSHVWSRLLLSVQEVL